MRRIIPTFFILIVALMFVIPVQAQPVIAIETIPLSDSYRRLPVKIYWQNSTECPAEFNQVLKKTLDTAIILLRKSIYRFMEENDGKYDELIGLRLEYVDNPDDAQIIISGKQLEEGVAGEAMLGMVDGKLVKAEINYDCEVVLKPMVPAFNVVLHELLHGLGLGHTEVAWDIMGPKDQPEPVIYVSNLDLEALYQLWFKAYDRDVYDLGPGAEHRQIKPYMVELNELEGIYRDLQSKYGNLSNEVLKVKADMTIVKNNLTIISSKVAEISKGLFNVSESLRNQGTMLKKQSEMISNIAEELNATEKFILSKAAETDYKFNAVARALDDMWSVIQGLRNVTALNIEKISGLEKFTARLEWAFIFLLISMAVVLTMLVYLILRMRSISAELKSLASERKN
jgi:hypothetical protein